jgi:hypothetical protein
MFWWRATIPGFTLSKTLIPDCHLQLYMYGISLNQGMVGIGCSRRSLTVNGLHAWHRLYKRFGPILLSQSIIHGTYPQILDDPTTSRSSLPAVRKRLIRLGKLGVIPLSIFVHFPASVQPSDYSGKAEYVASGGVCVRPSNSYVKNATK